MKSTRAKLVGAGVSVLVALVLVEGALHLAPRLLPVAYRESFPSHGVELERRGALAGVPVEGFALPRVRQPFDGRPPLDLVELGIAPADVSVDHARWPRVRTPADARGFPNEQALERADVVLLGDSFVLAASSVEPPGLVVRLREALGRDVYSLGVAGVGPQHEGWLLEHVALPLAPRTVLWFFFGGNDLNDAKNVLVLQREGRTLRTQLESYRAPPRLLLPDLVRFATRTPEPATRPQPLPPFSLAGEPVWFHPAHLGRCALDEAAWRGHVAWEATRASLRTARERSAAAGASFAVVYLPSKAETLLEVIDPDPELLLRHVSFGLAPLPATADETARRLLANRRALAQVLSSFCADEGIPFLDATPTLEALARRGTSGFLSADSHWSPVGQEALVGPLVRFLEQNGLLGD